MKKIALLTPFDTGNIGTVLQAYATQTLIKENGCETDLIYYHYDSIQKPFLISNLFKRGLKNYIGSIAGFLMRSPARKSLWRFIKTHLNLFFIILFCSKYWKIVLCKIIKTYCFNLFFNNNNF